MEISPPQLLEARFPYLCRSARPFLGCAVLGPTMWARAVHQTAQGASAPWGRPFLLQSPATRRRCPWEAPHLLEVLPPSLVRAAPPFLAVIDLDGKVALVLSHLWAAEYWAHRGGVLGF